MNLFIELIKAPQTVFEFLLLLVGIIHLGFGIIEINLLYTGMVLLICYFCIKLNNFFIGEK